MKTAMWLTYESTKDFTGKSSSIIQADMVVHRLVAQNTKKMKQACVKYL